MNKFCIRATFFSAAIVAAGMAAPVLSQDAGNYPSQSIKLLITNPPGGLPDTVARLYGRALETRIGQSVIVENRPGANGAVTVSAMMSAPANGYTFIVTDGSIYAANPHLYPNLSYSEKDLKAVATMARAPMILAVHPKVEANNLADFVAYVRANPGKLNFGSAGMGSGHHLSAVALMSALKLDMVHVPFKGTGEAVPALLGGHIDMLFSAYPSLSGAAETKQIKMLAANSGKRSPLAPTLPALGESIPGYDYAPLIGMYARSGTPDVLIQKIASHIVVIANDPEMVKRLATVGVEAAGGGPEQHLAALEAESKRTRELIQATGLKMK